MSWVDLVWLAPLVLAALGVLFGIAWFVLSVIAYAASARATDRSEK